MYVEKPTANTWLRDFGGELKDPSFESGCIGKGLAIMLFFTFLGVASDTSIDPKNDVINLALGGLILVVDALGILTSRVARAVRGANYSQFKRRDSYENSQLKQTYRRSR